MPRRVATLALLSLLSVSLAHVGVAQTESEARVYPVSEIRIETPAELSSATLVEALAKLEVKLGEDPDRWTVPSPNRPTRSLRIADIGREGVVALDRSAIIEICGALVRELQSQGRLSTCAPDPRDIARGTDLRKGNTELRLKVVLTRLADVRTWGTGDRWNGAGSDALNNPVHRKLRAAAPGARRGLTAPLLDASQLEEYAARLSRHPGRTVGLVYSRASTRDAGLTADLVVTEAKPWAAYFQTADTGTSNTGRYRNRVGFTSTQLTGNDDVFQLEYMTSDFDQIQAASTSYEAPVPGTERARFKLFGAMSRFDNDELGFIDAHFRGTRSELGVRVVNNVYQRGTFFADVSIGLRGQSLAVDNGAIRVTSRDRFLLPSIGARIEQRGAFGGFTGGIELETNLAKLAGTNVRSRESRGFFDGAAGLGRPDPDADFRILRFDLSGSLFLDALLSKAPASDVKLAHELYARVGGQHAFANRLVPQEQAVAGGRDSVRGYDQAAAVGDSVYLGTVEYRYHLPRSLTPRPAALLPGWLGGGRFRYAPEQAAGEADWDLVLKGSLDVARVLQSDRLIGESNETLVGVGVGLELRVRRNFTVALDLGVPLKDSRAIEVDTGKPELHFSLTTLY